MTLFIAYLESELRLKSQLRVDPLVWVLSFTTCYSNRPRAQLLNFNTCTLFDPSFKINKEQIQNTGNEATQSFLKLFHFVVKFFHVKTGSR
jgi:hypothetical protein